MSVLNILAKDRMRVRRLGGEPEDPVRDAILRSNRLWIFCLSFLALGLVIVCQTVWGPSPVLSDSTRYTARWPLACPRAPLARLPAPPRTATQTLARLFFLCLPFFGCSSVFICLPPPPPGPQCARTRRLPSTFPATTLCTEVFQIRTS